MRPVQVRFLVLASLLLCLPQTSMAYVDPGTGAYVVQSTIAVVGAVLFYATRPGQLVRRIRQRLWQRRQPH